MADNEDPKPGEVIKGAFKEALTELRAEWEAEAEEKRKKEEEDNTPPPARTDKPNNGIFASLFGG